jgi:hypothetical protein
MAEGADFTANLIDVVAKSVNKLSGRQVDPGEVTKLLGDLMERKVTPPILWGL